VHPLSKYRDFKEKGFKRFWQEDILRSSEPDHKKAAAVALGVFVGLTPFWGFHTLLVFLFAAALRLNKVTAFLFSNISILPLIPLVVYAGYQAGSFIMGKGFQWELRFSDFDSSGEMFNGFVQYLMGSFALATFLSLLLWLGSYCFISLLKRKQLIKS
jgi:uncharacterized protein (DUF2062 family)